MSTAGSPAFPGTEAAVDVRPPRRRLRRRGLGKHLLAAWTWLIILYTIVPIAVMVVYGFNATPSGRLTFSWLGFTTEWYRRVFEIEDLTNALVTTLQVGGATTLVAVLLGTPLALALARYRFWGRTGTDLVIFVDIAAPSVVVGASLLALFISVDWPRGFVTILIAHVAFDIAFVAVVVRARVQDLDRDLEKAAYDLGANPWSTFLRVTFPLILPGIIAAALLAFVLSVDDFIITQFVAGQTLTFPLWVWGSVKIGIPPQVFVIGTLIFFAGVVIAIANTLVQRRSPA
jgi:spermidine/putrescine transport system permease protein